MKSAALFSALFSALICATSLAAGEAADGEIRRYELADRVAVGRVHDAARSVQRYQGTPYAAFMQTPTGITVQGQILTLLTEMGGGDPTPIKSILANFTGGSFTFDLREANGREDPRVELALGFADPGPFFNLLQTQGGFQQAQGTTVPTWQPPFGNDVIFEQHPGVAVMAAADGPPPAVNILPQPPAPLSPEADLEGAVDFTSLAAMARKHAPPGDAAVFDMLDAVSFDFDATLVEHGVDEVFRFRAEGEMAETMRRSADVVVSQEAFAYLPATTLWAVAWAQDSEVTQAGFADLPEELKQGMGEIDQLLQSFGLPPYLQLLSSLDGTGLVYAEEVDGAYVLTIEQEIAEDVGARLAELVTQQLAPQMAGVPPMVFQVLGYNAPPDLAAAYRDGRLTVTMHPGGVDAVADRDGGFAELEAVQAGLARLPEEGNLLGVSNSPRSWGATGALIGRAVEAGLGIPLLNNLGNDLEQVAQLGYLAMTVDEHGNAEVRGGGMIGPVTGYGVGVAGVGALTYWMFMRAMQQMGGGLGPVGHGAQPIPPAQPAPTRPAP